ncbi:MAG: hypothetical protein Phyf2KO_03430 [Phycisphaerales bacterium]
MLISTLLVLTLASEPNSVAFASSRDSGTNIYTMHTDGDSVRRITDDGSSYAPAWSPDGKTIAFNSHRSGGWKIWLVDSDGKNPRRLTSTTSSGFNYEYFPSWAPDGDSIVFEKWNNKVMRFQINAVQVDGTHERVVYESDGHCRLPSYSPDGSAIAFNSNEDGDEEIYTVSPDGTNVRKLTDNDAIDFGATFSSDGKLIVFHSNLSGEFRTYTMKPDGSDVRLIEQITAQDHRQGWTATDSNSKSIPYHALQGTGTRLDSTTGKLIFQSASNGEWDIWSIDLHSGERERLTDHNSKDWQPAIK